MEYANGEHIRCVEGFCKRPFHVWHVLLIVCCDCCLVAAALVLTNTEPQNLKCPTTGAKSPAFISNQCSGRKRDVTADKTSFDNNSLPVLVCNRTKTKSKDQAFAGLGENPARHSKFKEQYHQIEWDYKRLDQLHNPEPYVEIGLKQDAPLLQCYNTSQQQLACDVKGSECWTNGDRPVDLCQLGSYGSCLSALRSRLICPMEGVFKSKGAVKMGGNHINKKVPAQFAHSPLPIESFLHLQSWHTRLLH